MAVSDEREALQNYYLSHPEDVQACMQAVRIFILNSFEEVSEGWKYRMPFFLYRGKMWCYIWTDKETGSPYLGIVDGKLIEHDHLRQGNRARMKILPLDVNKDLPVEVIREVLQMSIALRNKS